MNKLKLILLIILTTSITTECQVLKPRTEQPQPVARMARYSFCVSLLPSANSGAVCYGIHRQAPDGTVEISFLRYETFLRQFGGSEPSRANPDRDDLMAVYSIKQQTIKDLWKLRYALYPFGKSQETGWGQANGVPNDAQMQILAKYGIERISDVIYGDNLIMLLRDLEDPAWIARYQNAK